MDPITLMMGATSAIGLGMKLFGSSGASSAAREVADASQQIAGLETQENAQRKQQMILTSQRQQIQNVRNSQMARSMALTSATAQGAQFGSGLGGGIGGISGQTSTNYLANSQNLQIGENIFGLDDKINAQKQRIAQAQGNMASSQGLSSMGGDIMGFAGSFSRIAGMGGGLFGGGSGASTSLGKPTPGYDY